MNIEEIQAYALASGDENLSAMIAEMKEGGLVSDETIEKLVGNHPSVLIAKAITEAKGKRAELISKITRKAVMKMKEDAVVELAIAIGLEASTEDRVADTKKRVIQELGL